MASGYNIAEEKRLWPGESLRDRYEAFGNAANQDPSSGPRFAIDLWEKSKIHPQGRNVNGVTDLDALREPCELRLIFAPLDLPKLSTRDGFLELFHLLDIPPAFTGERLASVSHSFGTQTDPNGFCAWFHFLCKHINLVQDESQGPAVEYHVQADPTSRWTGRRRAGVSNRLPQADYSYIRSGIFLRASSHGATTLVCFGASPRVRAELELSFTATTWQDVEQEPLVLLHPIIQGLFRDVDQNVWNMSTVFGALEHKTIELSLQRQGHYLSRKMPFADLHNVAKHVIHLVEAVEAMLLVAESLLEHLRSDNASTTSFGSTSSSGTSSSTLGTGSKRQQLRERVSYSRSLFRSTRLRLNSLQRRVDNTLTLAFNVVTQQDSVTMMQDSNLMKIIAAITMLFLPTTAIASVMGSQLFVTEKEGDIVTVTASPLFRTFGDVAIPLTVFVCLSAFIWHRIARREEGFKRLWPRPQPPAPQGVA